MSDTQTIGLTHSLFLLVHNITGYRTINKIHMFSKNELIMVLQEDEQIGLQFFISIVD